MAVSETLEKLALLQRLNARIERCKKDRNMLSLDVEKIESKLEELRQELERVKKEQVETQKRADACEVKIREAEEKNEKLQIELNTTKRQKEYDAIRRSMQSNQADIQKWEDEEIEALDRADELKAKREELKGEVEEKENELEELRRKVAEERREYDEKLEELSEKRKSVRNGVDDRTLRSYERIARSLEGHGLARVKDRVCHGCFTTVTKQTENELMRDEEIVYCSSCGRMLILANSQEGARG